MSKLGCFLALTLLALPAFAKSERIDLLHVSYDATRELFADYNRLFKKQHPGARIRMSHGGSGKQARAVMDGLPADIVSLALAYDVEMIARRKGQKLSPHVPFYSTIVFLVREGNPKQIHDWSDLTRSDVVVLTPNPKSSGAARWGYLAAWGYAEARWGKDSKAAKAFMKSWLSSVPIFDTGARAATTNFVRRNQGDVLITWENEAYLAQHYFGKDRFEIVMPSVTMKAEPVVAVLTDKPEAEAYVNGLFAPDVQQLAANHFFRTKRFSALEPLTATKLLEVDGMGGWEAVQKKHFDKDGQFDQLMRRGE